MFWTAFPLPTGSISLTSGPATNTRFHYKDLGFGITEFTAGNWERFLLKNPHLGTPSGIPHEFKRLSTKYPCIRDAFNRDEMSKSPDFKNPSNNVQFGEDSKGCLAVWGSRDERPNNKWEGTLNVAWSLYDSQHKRIFLSSLYTRDGKLYAKGMYFFLKKSDKLWVIEKQNSTDEAKEREITKENLKNFFIRGNHHHTSDLPFEDWGFGKIDFENICSKSKGDNCSVSWKHRRIERRWELDKDICKESWIYKWSSNYKDWTSDNGLFPSLKGDLQSTVKGCYVTKRPK